jgi:hypothetical protein
MIHLTRTGSGQKQNFATGSPPAHLSEGSSLPMGPR